MQRSVTVQRGQSASLLVSMMGQAAFGWVSISSPVVLQVLEDDRKLGTSETDRIVLPAGQHTLRILNQRLGFQTARVVACPPAEAPRLRSIHRTGVVQPERAALGQKPGSTAVRWARRRSATSSFRSASTRPCSVIRNSVNGGRLSW